MADGFDANGRPYLNTLSGSRVQNMEERVIADWLFYNGVDFEYKRSYEFDSVRDIHRQNQPNFYYPDADAYHEHAALPVGAPLRSRRARRMIWPGGVSITHAGAGRSSKRRRSSSGPARPSGVSLSNCPGWVSRSIPIRTDRCRNELKSQCRRMI